MRQSRRRGSVLAVFTCLAMVAGMLGATVGIRPAAADVSSVSGSAFGYQANVGLFDGYAARQGFGQVPCTGSNTPSGCAPNPAASASPDVTLPVGGSTDPVPVTDPDGATGQFGPAKIFSGIWPNEVQSASPSGPITVSTQGTASGGSVTSSAGVGLYDTPLPAGCASGYSPPCTSPGGIGPSPVIADEASSTCTANESGVSGSSSFVNGKLETKFDKGSQLPIVTELIPDSPPPNYTRSGTLDHIGDRWTVILNEQILGPDSITVNAVHMLLHGPIAKGDLIIGSSTCSLGGSSVANGAPVANNDAVSTVEDTPLTVTAPGVLANDSDPDGNPLSVSAAKAVFFGGPAYPFSTLDVTWTLPSDPPHGTATLNDDGSFTYTPDANYTGTDSFKYLARDARGATGTGTVTVTVTPVPDAPVAVDDNDRATEDTPFVVAAPGVLGNDTDGDGDALTAGSASVPAHGTVVLNANGSYTYTPEHNYLGSDSFTYVVTDSTGSTDSGTVNLAVSVDEARILKDISAAPFRQISGYTPFDGAVFFTVEDGFSPENQGLWKTDGTAAGTVLVKNLTPFASSPAAVVGDTMFFQARDDTNGLELWKTDGTTAGTGLVKDIRPGSEWSEPKSFKAFNGALYFTADDGSHGFEVWTSDGTEAGTVLLKDINPGTPASSPGTYTVSGTTMFFSATTAASGFELWQTDGTAAGTAMVKEINPGTTSSAPASLTVMGGNLYFGAANAVGSIATNNTELWRSDGTEAGTVMVKDILPGTGSSRLSGMIAMGSTLLFMAKDGDVLPASGFELWRSDGTEAGTTMVRDIKLGASGGGALGLKAFGDVAYFSANDGLTGGELWKTDGTEEGTVMIRDIKPGDGQSYSSPIGFTAANGAVYFVADDGAAHGKELWKTDGTEAGTVLAKDIFTGSNWSSPTELTPALGTMFFTATQKKIGTEPWRLSPPKAAPVATADTYSGDKNTPLKVAAPGVLANDTDVNLDPLTAGSASDPANGSVTLKASGAFTYLPDPNFTGTDSFTYVVDDDDGGSTTGTVTIDVGVPTSLSVADVAVAEGDAGTTSATFTVTRSGRVSGPSTVKYKTTAGTATAGTDYTTLPLSTVPLSFEAGETTKTVTVDVATDTIREADQTFNLVLSAPTGAVITDNSGTATIVNDDGQAFLSVDDLSVTEGDTGTATANFTITRSGNTTGPSTVSYQTAPATATSGTDYAAVALTEVTFAAGETSKTVAVDVIGDTDDESNEKFTLALSAPAKAVIADASGTATIVDDEGTVTPGPKTFLSVDDPSVVEGDAGTAAASFTITRSGDTTGASTVKFKTTPVTATGSDYTPIALGAPISFAAGESTKTVTVDVAGDTAIEGDETFNLVLSAPTGANISDTSGTATIVDDDASPSLSVDDVSVIEGNAGTVAATFTITRSGNTTSGSTVKYTTVGGTATTADYTPVALTSVTFAAGETTKSVNVLINGDSLNEATESFTLVLSAPTKATIADATGVATIYDND